LTNIYIDVYLYIVNSFINLLKKGELMQSQTTTIQFFCDKDGLLDRKEVDLLCNHCRQSEVKYRDKMFLCPSCLENQEGNFACRCCGSKKVTMIKLKSKKYQ